MTYSKRKRGTYKRSAKKSYKRKRGTSKKKRGPSKAARASAKILTTSIGMPLKKTVVMTYYETLSLKSTGVAHAAYAFNLASINDPNFTGVGHQPYGHDDWALYYRQYRVSSATMKVHFSPTAGQDLPVRVGVWLDSNNSLQTLLTTKMEQSKGRMTRRLGFDQTSSTSITVKYDPRLYFGIKDIDDDHQSKGVYYADPILPAYCMVWVQSADGAFAESEYTKCLVSINFTVELSDPIQLLGS